MQFEVGTDEVVNKGNYPDGSLYVTRTMAQRVLVYNPDAIAQWLYQKYTTEFSPVMEYTQLAIPMLAAFPPVTPVCFGTMRPVVISSTKQIFAFQVLVISDHQVGDVERHLRAGVYQILLELDAVLHGMFRLALHRRAAATPD